MNDKVKARIKQLIEETGILCYEVSSCEAFIQALEDEFIITTIEIEK